MIGFKDFARTEGAAGLENKKPVINAAGPAFEDFADAAGADQPSAKAEGNVRAERKPEGFKFFRGDLKILFRTVRSVLFQEDVAVDTDTAERFLDEERKAKA